MGHHTPNVQSIRRQTAGHRGPLQKILVANRGVSGQVVFLHTLIPSHISMNLCRKSRSGSLERLTNWPCTLWLSTLTRTE